MPGGSANLSIDGPHVPVNLEDSPEFESDTGDVTHVSHFSDLGFTSLYTLLSNKNKKKQKLSHQSQFVTGQDRSEIQ